MVIGAIRSGMTVDKYVKEAEEWQKRRENNAKFNANKYIVLIASL